MTEEDLFRRLSPQNERDTGYWYWPEEDVYNFNRLVDLFNWDMFDEFKNLIMDELDV